MNATEMFELLSPKESESVTERFIHAMHAQATDKAGGAVTAAMLVELYADVEKWAERRLLKVAA